MTKEQYWEKILAEFDKWQVETHDQGDAAQWSNGHKVGEYTPKSREQLMTQFLGTPKGRKLYADYSNASEEIEQIVDTAKKQPMTLRELANDELDKIAKRYQSGSLSFEQGYKKALENDSDFREIYGLVNSVNSIADIDFYSQVSKSKKDAISVMKKEIWKIGARSERGTI